MVGTKPMLMTTLFLEVGITMVKNGTLIMPCTKKGAQTTALRNMDVFDGKIWF